MKHKKESKPDDDEPDGELMSESESVTVKQEMPMATVKQEHNNNING